MLRTGKGDGGRGGDGESRNANTDKRLLVRNTVRLHTSRDEQLLYFQLNSIVIVVILHLGTKLFTNRPMHRDSIAIWETNSNAFWESKQYVD